MKGQMTGMAKVSKECILLVAFFAALVLATEIQEPCDDYKPPVDKPQNGYIFKFGIKNCKSREDCAIKKGQNLSITMNFMSRVDSKSAEMHVLVDSQDENGSNQMQIPGLVSNLCKVKEFRKALGGEENTTASNPPCNIKENKQYTLKDFQLFVPRLMPTGNVNLTFLISGEVDALACALVRANFKD